VSPLTTPNGLVDWPDQINCPFLNGAKKKTQENEKEKDWGMIRIKRKSSGHD